MSEVLKQLLAGNIEQVAQAIADMDGEQLEAVEAAEIADSNRKGVLQAIAERHAALNPPAPPEKPKAETAAQDDDAAWKKPDYAGSLTSGQASWRNAHLKGQLGRAKK